MWQVVYIASTESEALEIEKKLSSEGFLIKIESMNEGGYQLKVPESEAEDVYNRLNEYF